MANTYELISSVTAGSGGLASIEFTSIPQIYTDLLIKFSVRGTSTTHALSLYMGINGNGGADYSARIIQGTGAGISSSTLTYATIGYLQGTSTTSNTFASTEVYIPNYTSSNNKILSSDSVTENNATTAYQLLFGSSYAVTNPITSITVSDGSSGLNMAQYSTAQLYGISKA